MPWSSYSVFHFSLRSISVFAVITPTSPSICCTWLTCFILIFPFSVTFLFMLLLFLISLLILSTFCSFNFPIGSSLSALLSHLLFTPLVIVPLLCFLSLILMQIFQLLFSLIYFLSLFVLLHNIWLPNSPHFYSLLIVCAWFCHLVLLLFSLAFSNFISHLPCLFKCLRPFHLFDCYSLSPMYHCVWQCISDVSQCITILLFNSVGFPFLLSMFSFSGSFISSLVSFPVCFTILFFGKICKLLEPIFYLPFFSTVIFQKHIRPNVWVVFLEVFHEFSLLTFLYLLLLFVGLIRPQRLIFTWIFFPAVVLSSYIRLD